MSSLPEQAILQRMFFNPLHLIVLLDMKLSGIVPSTAVQKKLCPAYHALGSILSVPDLIISNKIDVVLIALNEEEHSYLHGLVRNCQGLNVEMMMVPDILELMTSLVQIKHIEGIPFLGIKSPALSTWNSIIKRAFDIGISIIDPLNREPHFSYYRNPYKAGLERADNVFSGTHWFERRSISRNQIQIYADRRRTCFGPGMVEET